MDPYEIWDRCRRNLNRYTLRAFSLIPIAADPLILDIGCGSGVPTLALMAACPGRFVAVDPDASALDRLRRKAEALDLSARIELIQASVLALPPFPEKFDVIVAEGSLHIAGFEAGMAIACDLLKSGGHALIHEPLAGDRKRRTFCKKAGLRMIDTLVLDEKIWWEEYFACLERAIHAAGGGPLFAKESREIAEFKSHPERNRSIYYILKKDGCARQ
ncbi:MAG: class I SAM-dependent methyltransferase [Acidobacteria bacterium]|jgi:SAM-dependent methyltransferase|nr:class I SAM-dependent methyltransferase [Acidobacteriota bacterium]